jgi:hypothetical protein
MGRRPGEVPGERLCADEERKDIRGMAAFMKVLEVETIVPCLVEVGTAIIVLSYLELDRHYCAAPDHDRIDATPESRDVELQIEPALKAHERALKEGYFFHPGLPLR